jgi:hypothetical protein
MVQRVSRISGWLIWLMILAVIAGIYYASKDSGKTTYSAPAKDKYGLLASDYDKNGWAKVRGEWVSNPRAGSLVKYSGGNVIATSSVKPVAVSTKQESNTRQEFNTALAYSSSNYERLDRSKDGKNNCQDAAILFYEKYSNKAHVRIIHNNNPNTGMNHLFNLAWVDEKWIEVESQTLYGGGMRVEWIENGVQKYNPAYNTDETDYWKQFAK